LIVAVLWMVNFTVSAQFLIIAPILPRIEEQLGVAEHLLGTLVTAYAIAVGVFALAAGPVSDRYGRRFILLLGTAVMTGALALHGLADSYATLLLVRALAGAGGGLLSGATVAYVGDYFPYRRRGWANGWIASGLAVGQILGVPAGAVLAMGSFRTPFLLFAALMIVPVVLLFAVVPAPDVRLADRLTLRTALDSYGRLLRRRDTSAAVAVYVAMFLSIALYVTYLPTWLETTFEVSGLEVATLFLVGGFANLLVGPWAGTLSDRIGRKGMIVIAGLGIGGVMATTTVVLFRFEMAYLQFLVVMVFVAMRISPQQSLVSSIVAADQRGALLSLCLALGQMGFAFGGTLSGLLYTEAGFGSSTVAAGLAAVVAALVLWAFIPEPEEMEEVILPGAIPETTGCAMPAPASRPVVAPPGDIAGSDSP
jgi:predicted MFS family arabinose efflux permease